MATNVLALLAVFSVIAVLVIYGFFSSSRPKKQLGGRKNEEVDIPEGMEVVFRNGLHPEEASAPVMYTVHTCRHCVRLKEFLADRGISILEVFLDDFEGEARRTLMKKLEEFNPRLSFPTLVTPSGSVVGFRPEKVCALLHIEI